MSSSGLLTPDGIRRTHERIAQYIHRTPIFRSAGLDALFGMKMFFKCENFQKVGAFKIRGATNAALLLSPRERNRGIATHSSGNHAQAVALAARTLGVAAYIVMPENAPRVKRAAVEGYGATVTPCGPCMADREAAMKGVLEQTGAHFIHPFDDERVISGQATAARELLMELDHDGVRLDALLAPIGGGGLMSGTCLAAGGSGVKLYGAEPSGADDASRSLATGKLQRNETVDTIADGLRTNLSELTFGILQSRLDGILTVDDDEILAALRLIIQRLKIVVEPSSAVPLAAVIRNRRQFEGKAVGIILSGGNVDMGMV